MARFERFERHAACPSETVDHKSVRLWEVRVDRFDRPVGTVSEVRHLDVAQVGLTTREL